MQSRATPIIKKLGGIVGGGDIFSLVIAILIILLTNREIAFVITPIRPGDNYNWKYFEVKTGWYYSYSIRNLDVFTDTDSEF